MNRRLKDYFMFLSSRLVRNILAHGQSHRQGEFRYTKRILSSDEIMALVILGVELRNRWKQFRAFRVDSFLDWAKYWIPAKYRSEALADLYEDIFRMRKAELTEWQIRRRICWQLGWLAFANVRLWISGAFGAAGWAIGKFLSH